jgi:FAD:protein FMN transferase
MTWHGRLWRDLAQMARLGIVWLLGVGNLGAGLCAAAETRFQFSQTEMAVPIDIVLYARSKPVATRGADAAFARLTQLNRIFSDYDSQSELMQLARTAGEGKAVTVSEDLWRVLCRSCQISAVSDGAFDVTVGPVVRLWRRARRQKELPPAHQLREALSLVGYRQIRLQSDGHKVELLTKGMRLDLGGIAKGYAAAEALAVLRRAGIPSALIHAGGDSALGDPPPDKKGWRIGVGMLKPDAPPLEYLLLSRCAVAASGDMWQFVVIDGKRYSHIVDPRTGVGLTNHSNVTVVAPDGATADALATAVSVLGPDRGLKLIDATPGAAALVLRGSETKPEVYHSRRWKDLPRP